MKEEFYNTEYGKIQKKRFDRLLLYGLLGIIFGFYLLITEESISSIIISIILLICSSFFIVSSIILRKREINNYINKRKKLSN